MRLNCGFLCIGYSLISMYLIYREGEELLWLLLLIKVGVVEPNSGFIYPILEDRSVCQVIISALFLRFRFQKAIHKTSEEVMETGTKIAEMDGGLPETNACYIYHVPWYCAKSSTCINHLIFPQCHWVGATLS